jgi:hypothetical protein
MRISKEQLRAIHAKARSDNKLNHASFVPIDHHNSHIPQWQVNRNDGWGSGQPVKNTKEDAVHEWNSGARSDRVWYADRLIDGGIDTSMDLQSRKLVSKSFNQLPDWFQKKMIQYMQYHHDEKNNESQGQTLPLGHYYKKPECIMCGKSHIKNKKGLCPNCIGKYSHRK